MAEGRPHSFEFVESEGFKNDLRSAALSKRLPKASEDVLKSLRDADVCFSAFAPDGLAKWTDVVGTSRPPPDDGKGGWLLFSLWKSPRKKPGEPWPSPDGFLCLWVDVDRRRIWQVHIRAAGRSPVATQKWATLTFAKLRFAWERSNNAR